jgi:opacity protein-like surface antigen
MTSPTLARSARSSCLAVLLALAGAVGLAPAAASAQASPLVPPADEYETTRAMAMGLGARASAASTAALSTNPANLALGRLYHIETVVGYNPQVTNFTFGASILDSFSSPVAMAMQYRYILGNGQNGLSGMDGRVGLAYAFSEAFSIGVAGRYTSFAREGQQEGDMRGPHVEGVNVDASIRVTPFPGLHIAAIGQNFIDYGSPYVARLVGGSISYTFENVLTLAVDGFADLSTFRDAANNIRPEMLLGGAAEVFTGEVPIRAGYFYDSGRGIHYVTAGVGYVRPEFAVDFAWRQQIVGDDDTWLTLSFRYFVH